MLDKIALSPMMESIGFKAQGTKTSDGSDWDFTKREGMLYVVARAVTANVPNGNGDYFSYEEIKNAYKTFEGKGLFVNHASNDPEKLRGQILSAKLIDNDKNDIYVKCLLEVNAKAFPELAQMIKDGHQTDFSMGCQVAHSLCSICSNKAKTTSNYCMHVKMHKGGIYNGKKVYEDNKNIEFIELSIVSKGADFTAKTLEIIARQKGLNLGSLLKAAASNPNLIDELQNPTFYIEKTVMAGIRRANKIRGGK